MLSHGFLTGALFLMVGFLYERTHTRQIADMGALAKPLPIAAGFFLFFAFGSLGLPGLSGFVGEFLSLLGRLRVLALAGGGRRPRRDPRRRLPALDVPAHDVQRPRRRRGQAARSGSRTSALREIVSLVPLVVFVIWLGVYPQDVPRVPARAGAGDPPPRHAVAARRERGHGALAQLVDAARGLF